MKTAKNLLATVAMATTTSTTILAQGVGIGSTSFSPDPSSILDVRSSEKGVLVSRMNTEQMLNIAQPAMGLLIYNTDQPPGFYAYNGQHWAPISDDMGNHAANQNFKMQNHWISNSGDNNGIFVAQNGKVGIGNGQPNATLSISGSVAIQTTSVTITGSPVHNLPVANISYIRLEGATADFTLTGLANGTDGQLLTIFNYSTFSMKIPNNNNGSLPENRVLTLNNSNYTSTGQGAVNLIYDGTIQRWVMLSARY